MTTETFRTSEFNDTFWAKHWSDRSQDMLAKNESVGVVCCMACGRALNPEKAKTAWIVGGGALVLHPDDYASYVDDGGDMGCWDLGPECAKLFPAKFLKSYVVR